MTTYASAAAVFDAVVNGELVPKIDLQWAHLEVCNLLIDHPGDRDLLDAEAGLSIWVNGGTLDLDAAGIERGHLLARHIAHLLDRGPDYESHRTPEQGEADWQAVQDACNKLTDRGDDAPSP